MDSATAARVVAGLGLAHGDVRPAEQGWSHHTFHVDPGWVFRFARDEAVAASLRREIAALAVIARHVTFAVPVFEHVGAHDGLPFVGYRRIEGRALTAGDLEGAGALGVAEALRQLHGVPLGEVAPRLNEPTTLEAWHGRYERLRDQARALARRVLSQRTAAAVDRGFERFLSEELPAVSSAAVVHYDLGCEHVLIAESGELSGIIDFEEVAVGDPTVDFIGLSITGGLDAVRRVHRAYGGLDDVHFEDRLRFYTWMGAYHELDYQLGRGDDQAARAAVASLEQRLDAAGLLTGRGRSR